VGATIGASCSLISAAKAGVPRVGYDRVAAITAKVRALHQSRAQPRYPIAERSAHILSWRAGHDSKGVGCSSS
jgi:hypothetical protein